MKSKTIIIIVLFFILPTILPVYVLATSESKEKPIYTENPNECWYEDPETNEILSCTMNQGDPLQFFIPFLGLFYGVGILLLYRTRGK